MKKSYLIIGLTIILIMLLILVFYDKKVILVESNKLILHENTTKKIEVLSNFSVNFNSNDTSIATVDKNGNVLGIKKGNTKIVISALGADSYYVDVIVKEKNTLEVVDIKVEANNEIVGKYIKISDSLKFELSFNREFKLDENPIIKLDNEELDYLKTSNQDTIRVVKEIEKEAKELKVLLDDEIIYTYELPKFDNEIPSCNLKEEDGKIVITGIDNNEIKDYAITQSDNFTYSSDQSIEYGNSYGTWYGYVRDEANNVGKCKIDIENKEVVIIPSEITIVGDSRMEGLCSYSWYKSDGGTCVAKSSMGYSWLNSTAAPQVTSLSLNKRKYIATNLGVNDLGRIDSYIKKYQDLALGDWKDSMIFLISVNPTDGKDANLNSQINSFNDKLKWALAGYNNVTYCDVASYLNKNGFQTSDGTHYKQSTSKVIYEQIKKCIYDYYNP